MQKYKYLIVIILLELILPLSMQAQRWEKITNLPSALKNTYWLDVYFLPSNPNYGWVCGYDGKVVRTTDGGSNWIGSTLPSNYQLESIHFPSVDVGYTSGSNVIFKSTNGGQTWSNVSPPSSSYNGHLWGCFFLDDNNGFVIGDGCGNAKQRFFRTTNGGTTWDLFSGDIFDSGLTDLIVYSMFGDGYASGSGWIWRTTDGGLSWSNWLDTGPSDWQEEITKVGNSILVPTSQGCSGGQNGAGGVRFTTDLGGSWNIYDTGSPMYGTFLLSSTAGWAAGFNGQVIYTSNGGLSWELRNCGFNNANLDDIWFNTPNDGWIVGDGIYKFSEPLQTADKSLLNFDQVCLPNSNNQSFNIKNDNFSDDFVSLEILNDIDNEFSIVSPGLNFGIEACESIEITVRFTPKNIGLKSAILRVNFGWGTSIDLNLNAFGIDHTIFPADTLIMINPVYCGSQNIESVNWSSSTDQESISKIIHIDGTNAIYNVSQLPVNISSGTAQTRFVAEAIDTGWASARFKCELQPCLFDTFLTVMAYGVSPIITSITSRSISVLCQNSDLDTIPIFNTGNDNLVISSASIVEPNTNFTVMGWLEDKTPQTIIAPGKFKSLLLRYVYNPGTGNIATLRLINNDRTLIRGNKSPWDIKVAGAFGIADLNSQDTIIDFGKVCLGGEAEHKFFLTNTGDMACEIIDSSQKFKQFEVTYDALKYPFQVEAGKSVRCTIKFRPDRIDLIKDTVIIDSQPCDQILKIAVSGIGINASMQADPDKVSAIMQTGVPVRINVKVKSTGTEDIILRNIDLSPPVPEIKFVVIPALPQQISASGSIDLQLEVTSSIDTIIDGTLSYIGDGACQCSNNRPIHLESYSSKVDFDLDSLDFGFNKCSEGNYVDSVSISNLGFITDTITRIELIPLNSPFKILNMPKLPYTFNPNDNLNLLIEFAAFNEGAFSATLTMNTYAFKNFHKSLYLTGEFRSANTSLSSSKADFGAVELCDIQKEIHIMLRNTGSLKDSITISRKNNLQNFVLIPDNYVIVPPYDSTELVIYMDPNTWLTEGSYLDSIYFTSQICPGIDILPVTVDIYHNRLEILPLSLDYETVWKDETATKNFTIENKSLYDKNIIYMQILPNDDNFIFVNQYSYPILFKKGDKLQIPVKFTALTEGNFNEQIRIFEESICIDTTYISLSADVPKEVYETTVSIGNYSARPGQTVTFVLNSSKEMPNLKHNGVDFQISFNPLIFYPNSVMIKKNGTGQIPFSSYNYSNGKISGFIDQTTSAEIFNSAGDIIWIKGTAFQTIPDSTDIKIDKFDPQTNKVVTITKIDGTLQLTNVCLPLAELGFELTSKPKVFLKNTPVDNGELLINYKSEDDNNSRIDIYNSNGIKVLENDLYIPNGENELKFDVSDFSSGVYYINIINNAELVFKSRFIVLN